jgi:hypothetical protein
LIILTFDTVLFSVLEYFYNEYPYNNALDDDELRDNVKNIRIIFNFNSIRKNYAGENYKNLKKTGQISKNNQKNWK